MLGTKNIFRIIYSDINRFPNKKEYNNPDRYHFCPEPAICRDLIVIL